MPCIKWSVPHQDVGEGNTAFVSRGLRSTAAALARCLSVYCSLLSNYAISHTTSVNLFHSSTACQCWRTQDDIECGPKINPDLHLVPTDIHKHTNFFWYREGEKKHKRKQQSHVLILPWPCAECVGNGNCWTTDNTAAFVLAENNTADDAALFRRWHPRLHVSLCQV